MPAVISVEELGFMTSSLIFWLDGAESMLDNYAVHVWL